MLDSATPRVIQNNSATTPLIGKSERPVKRSVAAAILAMANVTVKVGANLVTIPLCLKYLGRAEYGMWIILQSLAFYIALSELGLGQTVMNLQGVAYAQNNYAQVNRLLTTSFGLYWLIVIPVWILLFIVLLTQPVGVWTLKDPSADISKVFGPYLLLAGTLTLVRIPLNVFPSTLLGLRESALRQLSDLGFNLFQLLATIVTLLVGGKLLALILVVNLGLIIITALNYPLGSWKHPELRIVRCYWTPSLLWPLLQNSLFFFLLGLGVLFQRMLGNLLAGKFGKLERVPEMFVLLALFRIIGWPLADVFSRTLQPYTIMLSIQGQRDRILFFVQLCTKFSFVFALTYSVGVWFMVDSGLKLWLGPGMFLGYGPLAFLIGSFLIEVLFLPTNNFMIALNRHKGISLAMATYAVLTLAFGVAGAVWWRPDNVYLGLCGGFFAASLIGQALLLPWINQSWLDLAWWPYTREFLLRPLGLVLLCLVFLVVFAYGSRDSLPIESIKALSTIGPLLVTAWFWLLTKSERVWLTQFVRTLPAFLPSRN